VSAVPDGDANGGQWVGKARMEAFSDGVFAIAITLLVLDLTVGSSGSALDRLLHAWPSCVAYVVSFLTIGAAWLAHTGITDRLDRADAVLLRINLVLLLVVVFLPFPTRLVAEALDDVNGERVFVTLYGVALVTIRVLVFALDTYARRERLYTGKVADEELESERTTLLPAVISYLIAIGVGLLVPRLAVVLYFGVAMYLVVPFREIARLLFRRA
jgi:uncharacterized membrane protein